MKGTYRHGWLVELRPGDRKQARRRVNYLVQAGRIPHPNDLPCVDCDHVYQTGERRHEYDHHKGYDTLQAQLDVVAVCTTCHHLRDNNTERACKNGHRRTPENTRVAPGGWRECLECRRKRDRWRRDAAYWREYRKQRRQDEARNV